MSNERSVELAGVDFTGQNHVCAFFNTMDEEHRVLGSFYKEGLSRGEKATNIVDSENREGYLKRLTDDGTDVQELMHNGQLEVLPSIRRGRLVRFAVQGAPSKTPLLHSQSTGDNTYGSKQPILRRKVARLLSAEESHNG